MDGDDWTWTGKVVPDDGGGMPNACCGFVVVVLVFFCFCQWFSGELIVGLIFFKIETKIIINRLTGICCRVNWKMLRRNTEA